MVKPVKRAPARQSRAVSKKPAHQTDKPAARLRLVRQLIGYTASGGARFWSGYGAFYIFDHLLGLHLWWAKQLANVLGLLVEFSLNRLFVFTGQKDRRDLTGVSFRFVIITAINFLIDYWIILRLSKLGVSPYIGQFVSAGFFWAWNFMWYKFWVFTGSGSRSG